MPTERDFSEMIAYANALANEGEGMAEEVTSRRRADVLSALPGMLQGRPAFIQALGDIGRKVAAVPQRAREQSFRALEGDPEIDIEPVMQASNALFTGGMPAAARGAAGIFGGRLAANADRRALREAELRLSTGEDPAQVYRATGWFKDPVDGEMKFEISDALATYKPPSHWDAIMLEAKQRSADPGTIRDVLPPLSSRVTHRELEKSYPGVLDEMRFGIIPSTVKHMYGGVDPENQILYVRSGLPRAQARTTALHELQHVVQKKEGFPTGGMTSTAEIQPIAQEAAPRFQTRADQFSREIEDAQEAYIRRRVENDPYMNDPNGDFAIKAARQREFYEDFWSVNPGLREQYRTARAMARDPDKALQEAQFSAYERISGEVEARNVQKRQDYSKTRRREIPPWLTMDRPPEGQIIIRPSQRVLPF